MSENRDIQNRDTQDRAALDPPTAPGRRSIAPIERRPLTARSVVASVLLGVDPPSLPANALVRSGELFGMRPGATRTALSRMAAAGEVEADDGHYRLVGPLAQRHRRQQAARTIPDTPWDGAWELAIVRPGRRPADDRASLRDAARRRNLAEIREGCWARPANLDPEREPDAAARIADACHLLVAHPDDPDDLVAAFHPSSWADDARALIGELQATISPLLARDESALGSTFVTAAAVLRHLVADPVLPDRLQPAGWPAAELRRTYAAFQDAFSSTWREWYRRQRQDS